MTKINLETKARAGFEAIMLRGGRLVKRKGQVISFAPHVGQLSSVSCSALAAGLALFHLQQHRHHQPTGIGRGSHQPVLQHQHAV